MSASAIFILDLKGKVRQNSIDVQLASDKRIVCVYLGECILHHTCKLYDSRQQVRNVIMLVVVSRFVYLELVNFPELEIGFNLSLGIGYRSLIVTEISEHF